MKTVCQLAIRAAYGLRRTANVLVPIGSHPPVPHPTSPCPPIILIPSPAGDTRPSPALVSAGRGATLLVHEATFEPCLEQQARGKRHCTSAEAVEVAGRMGAYRWVKGKRE